MSLFVAILLIATGYGLAHALPYAPGQTLDPSCSPGDVNCTVRGVIIDNGAVAGINATSSTDSFNIQGSGMLNPFNIASSSGASLLTVQTNGYVGIGTSSPAGQLDLESYTVTTDGGGLTGGNPQLEVNGTLDTTNTIGHVTGAQLYWNTIGTNNLNVNGMRMELNTGYTGGGLTRVADFANMVQGAHSLGIADTHGNFGISAEAQGGYADDSTIGDNVGVYAIANGSKNVNVAVYGRSFDQAPTNAGYSVANIGVIGVASHNYLGPASTEIGGFFAAGGSGNWYNQLATTSAALLLDNENEGVPLLIGRVNGSNAFTINNIGGITSTSTANAVAFWQINNASGTPLFNLDTSDLRVGIGTSAPADNLVVTNPNGTAFMSLRSAGNSVGNGNVNFRLFNGDNNSYGLQYGGNGNSILKFQYNGSTKWSIGNLGQLVLNGTNTSFANQFTIINATSTQNIFDAKSASAIDVLVLTDNGDLGIATTTPAAKLDINGTSIILEQSSTPASSSDTCTTGMLSWDSGFVYVCVATNTWKRSALTTW